MGGELISVFFNNLLYKDKLAILAKNPNNPYTKITIPNIDLYRRQVAMGEEATQHIGVNIDNKNKGVKLNTEAYKDKTNTGKYSVSGIGAAEVWREPGPELDRMALDLALELNLAWPWRGAVKYIAQDILNVLAGAQVHHEANPAAPSAEATAATVRANCLAWAAHYSEAQRLGRYQKKVSLSFCITAGEWMAPPTAAEAASDADSRFAAALAASGRVA
jgi:hypothetical protein